jgi:tetratricopeptide (TPR) repeat protein
MTAKTRREQIEEMLADEPNDPELRYMLAMEHVSAGDDAGAVRCFEELLRIEPAYPPGYHMAGQALLRLGRIEPARELLRRGVEAARRQGNLHAAEEMQGLLMSLE